MSGVPDINKLVLKDTAFDDLMNRHIYNILLVATHYDSFILEEDGRIEEQIYNEYVALSLTSPPRFTQVSTEEEALEILSRRNFELIILMPNMDHRDIFAAATEIKHRYSHIPIVVLTPFSREVSKRVAMSDMSAIDYIFCWQGDPRLILTITKLIEDKMNAEEDTARAGVQIILLVEDSVRFYSLALTHLYQFVLEQSKEFSKETLNDHQKTLRMRGRPKIMLARNYEEAVSIFDKYRDHILGIVSDMSITFSHNKDPYAGYRFGQYVRRTGLIIPMILESSDAASEALAREIHAAFILKASKQYPEKLRQEVSRLFGFGDFVIVNPDTGQEIMRIKDLKDLQNKIFDIPDASLAYHLSQNHFSRFFYSRAMFPPADILKGVKVSDYRDMDEARQLIFHLIVQYRRMKNTGTIAIYERDRFDQYSNFARIGNDSLGGKGRGLAFLGSMIKWHPELDAPNLHVTIPKSVVVCTDVFDQFMSLNHLYPIALSGASDEEILQAFLGAALPDSLLDDISALTDLFRGALVIRSSSLLEDSHYQPFAGVYATYMVPNIGDKRHVVSRVADAIKAVYASTFYEESKTYMRATGNLIEQEKMSVILQEVVGHVIGSRLYPNISGVARSLNYYPLDEQRAEEGICDIALGLGKYIVDGGKTLHFSPVRPRKVLQMSTLRLALRDTQTQYYALDLKSGSEPFSVDDGFNLLHLGLKDAEADGMLKYISSTYEPESQMIYDGCYPGGRKVISFANILQHNQLPLASTLHRLLDIGQREMGRSVEMEFAVNFDEGCRNGTFYLLQIRPIVGNDEDMEIGLSHIDDADKLIASNSVLGHGRIRDIRHILYVKSAGYQPSLNVSLASRIHDLNTRLIREQQSYVLIGPGRWGSSDSRLGIPVKWTDISGAAVICERMTKGSSIEPSQGTHFFQNLTSLGVGYFTLTVQDGGFYDEDWLNEQPAAYEDEHLRLVTLSKPICVLMDGRHSRGVVLKPDSRTVLPDDDADVSVKYSSF